MEVLDMQPAKRLKLATSREDVVNPLQCKYSLELKSNMKTSTKNSQIKEDKFETLQRMLKAVLHSRQCADLCDDPYCTAMKRVLGHLVECEAGRSCTVSHCSTTRQVIEHYSNCRSITCTVCCGVRQQPVKTETDTHVPVTIKEEWKPEKIEDCEFSACVPLDATVLPSVADVKETSVLSCQPSSQSVNSAPTSVISSNRGSLQPLKIIRRTVKLSRKSFDSEELRRLLMPTWQVVYNYVPHSLAFQHPVDPVRENIPDYFTVIKNPMDLSTILRKLQTGEYEDPWQYVEDMQQMFTNAWTYNRRSSPYYKSCTKLAERFESSIDEPMKALGCCCGQKRFFKPLPLCCCSRLACTIPIYGTYYNYRDKYVFCEKCFAAAKVDVLEVIDSPTRPPVMIKKEEFVRTVNMKTQPEPFVQCKACERKFHQICVLQLEQIWPSGYICDSCLRESKIVKKPNPFTAQKLFSNKLSRHLENRINMYLRRQDPTAAEVTVRVLASGTKLAEVKPRMKERFPELPDGYPYTAKSIYAFQTIDGVDICFFGLHVQEYGSNAPAPNQRRVYLAYLDSVHYFRPKYLRTAVYHELLIGYMDYVKALGFVSVHIWACPPAEGDDYIFHRHPVDQKTPKPRRLQDWYRKLLDRASAEGVVANYKDVASDSLALGISSPLEIPYFDGDFWPNVLEEAIEEEERAKNVDETAVSTEIIASGSSKSNAKKSQKTKKSSKGRKAISRKGTSLGLFDRVKGMIEKHKEMFFTVYLRDSWACRSQLQPIRDPDISVPGELMDSRGAFLMFCRDRRLEFATLRRAKFSTMLIVSELHTEQSTCAGELIRCCKRCSLKTSSCMSCTECENYDLCSSCYEKGGHSHEMVRRCYDGSVNNENTVAKICHAAQCTLGAHCPQQPDCAKFGKVLNHARTCTTTDCMVCRRLNTLCASHAQSCTLEPGKCPVPLCAEARRQIKHRMRIDRQQQQLFVDRRCAVMKGEELSGRRPKMDSESEERHVTEAEANVAENITRSESADERADLKADWFHSKRQGKPNSFVDHSSERLVVDGVSVVPMSSKLPAIKTDSAGDKVVVSHAVNRAVSVVHTVAVTGGTLLKNACGKNPPSLSSKKESSVSQPPSDASLARKQLVLNCLKILFHLNPKAQKNDILMKLVRYSDQEIQKLYEKLLHVVKTSSSRNVHSIRSVAVSAAAHTSTNSSLPPASVHGQSCTLQSSGQQLVDIVNLPHGAGDMQQNSVTRKPSSIGFPPTANCPMLSGSGQTLLNGKSSVEQTLTATDVLANYADTL